MEVEALKDERKPGSEGFWEEPVDEELMSTALRESSSGGPACFDGKAPVEGG